VAIAKRERRTRLLFDPKSFPLLNNSNHRTTSDPVEEQNCIAFAAGDRTHCWWPIIESPHKCRPPYFWPKACDPEETIEAFVCAYQVVGFQKCDEGETGSLENGIEKIAIFAKDFNNGKSKEPTHAAVQSPTRNGKWRSKMGKQEDIEHELHLLEGRLYGKVVVFMKRTFAQKEEAEAKLRKRLISSH
jgi:hypothetical protein